MKKSYLYLLLMLFIQQANAETFYDQLCRFNSNWKKHKLAAPAGNARCFDSDKEYIGAHLSSVIPVLRSNPVAHLNAGQFKERMRLIEVLDAYRLAGNFPLNYYRKERIPVFIDEHNTHCAVGFLLLQSGYGDLALRIAKANNYAWLKDIHFSELLEWQQSSGFSLVELKLIQGAYDYYMPFAFTHPQKFEIPQKPACIISYFKNGSDGNTKKKRAIWCRGEGTNGVLNGRWEQNYSADLPWIVGYYENGKRSGQWLEYYQGTTQLCRTEIWQNDKLNGIRRRFDRSGVLIEEILFKDGNAITKTNLDFADSLMFVRKPIDSSLVYTEVFTLEGVLIAMGHEKVHNPGNLQWFQNIELTALNTISVASRDIAISNGNNSNSGNNSSVSGSINLYNTPPLVSYKKEGKWIYKINNADGKLSVPMMKMLVKSFYQNGRDLYNSINLFKELELRSVRNSIMAEYKNNILQNIWVTNADKDSIQIPITDMVMPDITSNFFLFTEYYNQPIQQYYFSSPFFNLIKINIPVDSTGVSNLKNKPFDLSTTKNNDSLHISYKEIKQFSQINNRNYLLKTLPVLPWRGYVSFKPEHQKITVQKWIGGSLLYFIMRRKEKILAHEVGKF